MGLPKQAAIGIANESLMDGRLRLAADSLYLDWRSAALFKSIYLGQWVMQLGTQYKATERVKLRLGYALATNPINEAVGARIGPVEVPGGIPAVKYLQSQFAIINEPRMAAGIGVSVGSATYVGVESYWLGVGSTWHFDRPTTRRSTTRS